MTTRLTPLETGRSDAAPAGAPALSVARWTALCALAEAIGMTAAAAAAKASQALVGDPKGHAAIAAALSLVVAGGLVEGIALGALQAAGLRRWLPTLSRRRWLLVTAAVAGLGWAVASAPGVLSGSGDGSTPPPLLVIGGGFALGAAMGALLGAAQAPGLRGLVRHHRRWLGINAAGWAPAMAIVFFGATAPGSDWSVVAVVLTGTATGALAGAVLGLITGSALPRLDGSSLLNRVVMRILRSRAHHLLDRSLLVLRVRGVVTGRVVELPVQYASGADGVVIVPGHPAKKRWWRNLVQPAPIDVLVDGCWRHGTGVLLGPGDPGYAAARSTYGGRWPHVPLPDDNPVVVVRVTAVASRS